LFLPAYCSYLLCSRNTTTTNSSPSPERRHSRPAFEMSCLLQSLLPSTRPDHDPSATFDPESSSFQHRHRLQDSFLRSSRSSSCQSLSSSQPLYSSHTCRSKQRKPGRTVTDHKLTSSPFLTKGPHFNDTLEGSCEPQKIYFINSPHDNDDVTPEKLVIDYARTATNATILLINQHNLCQKQAPDYAKPLFDRAGIVLVK